MAGTWYLGRVLSRSRSKSAARLRTRVKRHSVTEVSKLVVIIITLATFGTMYLPIFPIYDWFHVSKRRWVSDEVGWGWVFSWGKRNNLTVALTRLIRRLSGAPVVILGIMLALCVRNIPEYRHFVNSCLNMNFSLSDKCFTLKTFPYHL